MIAFNVPNLIRSLVADNAISAAFVPVFVELRETRGEAEAWRVASIVIWMTAIVLGAVSAIFMLAAPLIMQLFVPGRGVSNSLVVSLTQIMFPIVVILGLTGVVTGILNSYNIFGLPAFAPVIWNLVIIGFLLADQGDIYAYAWGVLVATIVQFLDPLTAVARQGETRTGVLAGMEQPARQTHPQADDPGHDRPRIDQHQPDDRSGGGLAGIAPTYPPS